MEPAGSGATWTLARRVSMGQCESTPADRGGSVEVTSKVDRKAVRRSLHRMVRFILLDRWAAVSSDTSE
jgi:hypothetical protein